MKKALFLSLSCIALTPQPTETMDADSVRIIAGAAIVCGIGYWAYDSHQREIQMKKQHEEKNERARTEELERQSRYNKEYNRLKREENKRLQQEEMQKAAASERQRYEEELIKRTEQIFTDITLNQQDQAWRNFAEELMRVVR